MARVDANQWLQKWGQRLNASGQYIQDGVKRLNTAPGQAAAAASDRMLSGVTEAVTSGRWARNVAKVSLTDWQNSVINKGIPRIAQGVTQAQNTKVQIITQTLAAVDQAAAAAKALPKGGIDASIARASTFMRTMSQLAPKKQGG